MNEKIAIRSTFIIFFIAIAWGSFLYHNDIKKLQLKNEKNKKLIENLKTPIVEINYCSYFLAKKHIKKYENVKLIPYELGGNWYIGAGHQIKKNEQYLMQGITSQQSDSLLDADLKKRIIIANKDINLFGDQALAYAMLIYNVTPATVKSSQLYGELQKPEKDTTSIIESWMSFCKWQPDPKIDSLVSNQKLFKRRKFEVNMFLYGN